MKKVRLRVQIILSFIVIAVAVCGQTLPRVEYLDIDDGLSQNTIQSIEKDRYGFMWFGTDNGLCRYDGYAFDYYFNNGENTHLWDNRILHLNYDNKNLIWVTTQKGLQVFNIIKNQFDVINDPELNEALKLDVIESHCINGSVWVLTKSNGIYRIDNENGTYKLEWKYWRQPNLPTPTTAFVKDSTFYLGTNNGIYTYNKLTDSFEPYTIDDNRDLSLYVQSLYDDGESLFVGTINGLFSCRKKDKELYWYNSVADNLSTLTHPSVTSLLKTKENELLIGTLGGFCRLNIDNKQIERISLFSKKKTNRQVEFISTLFKDELGNVWVGTEKIGLAHYNIYQNNFKSFEGYGSRFDKLNDAIVNSIYKRGDYLWVGTAGVGLARVNLNEKKIKFLGSDGSENSIGSDFVTSICEDKYDNLWVGTWGLGVRRLKESQGENFMPYHIDKGLPSDFISFLYMNQKGEVVVGTQNGLCIYDYENDCFYPVGPSEGAHDGEWRVGCLLEDDKGYYWVGTTDGLHRFNGRLVNSDAPTVIAKYDQTWYRETKEENSLPNNYVTCLAKDSKGNVWLGTYGGGIAKSIESEGGNFGFQKFTQKDGLANNVVYAIVCDKDDNLWVTTENGLSEFVVQENRFVNYYKQDGLRNNQYYWTAASVDRQGYLYFGGLNGLNYFHPDSISGYPFQTTPVITALNIYNDKVLPGEKYHGVTPLKKSVFSTDSIVLSHKDNVFSLEFSALNYLHASKIKYAYRLEGVDKSWVEVSAQRRLASYTNLRGGDYLFQLKSTNVEGQWNDEIKEVYIEVIPPIYQTMWFKVLMILLLVLLVSGYIQYRSFRITIQKKRLEELVRQRTNEINEKNKQLEEHSHRLVESNIQLEKRRSKIETQKTQLEDQNKEIISQRDQLIALNKEVENIHHMRMQFFTNISHEFRTPLTLIIAPLERLLNQKGIQLQDEVRKSIKTVKRNAERLLLLTSQILTFRKMEAGKLSVVLSAGEVDKALLEIGEAFNELAKDKRIYYDLIVEEGNYQGWYDKSKLENIMFNLLSNAFKYTPENEKVELKVSLCDKDGHGRSVMISVTDSGQGIKEDILDKVFDRYYRADNIMGYGTGLGLALVKELVNSLNGEISVTSIFGNGASFHVVLPIEQSAFGDYSLLERDIEEPLGLKDKVRLLQESNEDSVFKDIQNDVHKPAVLIVEDNDDLRQFMAESLCDSFNIVTAKDGQEGYEQAVKLDFDIVVSDVMMPRLNGLDLCKQLKNNLNTSHLPVVLLSAKGMEENQVEGMGVGADDYITKPFNLNVLSAKISSLIENRQRLKKIFLNNTAEDDTFEVRSLDDEFMQKVNEVVSEFYANPSFDIETFSSKMYVSRSLLYKKLKALTNVSPNEYINVFRLKKAVPLLKSKKYQVAEVAVMVGFNDPKYFSRVFKKFYKCSPSEYTNS